MSNIRNYTSQVSANRSIALLEAKLAAHGAREILKMYGPEGRVAGIAFIVPMDGTDFPFKLPAKVSECEAALKASVRKPRRDTMKRIKEQAERTAWKLVADWVDVQLTMIKLRQAEFMEVFLPYLYNHNNSQTYFESIKEKGFQKLLPAKIKT